jgi:hypothetical protein
MMIATILMQISSQWVELSTTLIIVSHEEATLAYGSSPSQ